jgi:hypothetical protein
MAAEASWLLRKHPDDIAHLSRSLVMSRQRGNVGEQILQFNNHQRASAFLSQFAAPHV